MNTTINYEELAEVEIMKECALNPKPDKESVIENVMERLAKVKPLTDYRRDEVNEMVTEMVNNYY
jgi:hypothetical protein